MNGRKNSVYLVWVLGSLCAVVAAGTFTLGVGPAWLSPSEVVRSLFGGGEEDSRTIVLDIRLPRIVLATLAGCALGVGGAAPARRTGQRRHTIGDRDLRAFLGGIE